MNQSERGRLKEGGANRSVSMVTGCLRCHSGARGRSLAGPSAMLHLEGANREKDAQKRGPIRGGDGVSRPQVSGQVMRSGKRVSLFVLTVCPLWASVRNLWLVVLSEDLKDNRISPVFYMNLKYKYINT